ncbi:hypothetical protein L218DRAFT_1006527 [Marasmius fiardii PR-910]|nr:hypothetical protein L218DRAFT_1006527 [Marasmius fiardii PR-910]
MTVRGQNVHHFRFQTVPRPNSDDAGKLRQHIQRQTQISPIERAICSLNPTVPQCAAILTAQGGGQPPKGGTVGSTVMGPTPDGQTVGVTTPSNTPPPITSSTTNTPPTQTQTQTQTQTRTSTPPLATKSNESTSGTSGPSGGSGARDISTGSSNTSTRTSSGHRSTETPPENSLTAPPTPSQHTVVVPTTITESAVPTQIISTAITRDSTNHTPLIAGSVLGVFSLLFVLICVISRRSRSSKRWLMQSNRDDISPFTIPAHTPQNYGADKLQVEREIIRGYSSAHSDHQPEAADILRENDAQEDRGKDSVIGGGTADNFGIPSNPPPSYRP